MKKSELIQLTLDENEHISYMCNAVKNAAYPLSQEARVLAEEIVKDIEKSIDHYSTFTVFLKYKMGISSITQDCSNLAKKEFISFLRRKRLERLRDQYIANGE